MVDLKQLKCPGCGSSHIEQQSEKLIKCCHCGSSLILKNNHLSSIADYSQKPTVFNKQVMAIIGLFMLTAAVFLYFGQYGDPPVQPVAMKATEATQIKVDQPKRVNIEKITEQKPEQQTVVTPKLEVVYHKQAETVIGGIYWIIKIKNISPQQVSRARAVVSLFDKDNKRIEEQSGWSIKEVLEPGESSVVLVLVAKPPANIDRIEFSANASNNSFMINNQVAMEVTDFVVNQNKGRYEIVGDVKNNNDFNVKYTKVVAEALDANGQEIGLAHQFSTQKDLQVGESSGFKITSTTFIAQAPASWRLWAIARKE